MKSIFVVSDVVLFFHIERIIVIGWCRCSHGYILRCVLWSLNLGLFGLREGYVVFIGGRCGHHGRLLVLVVIVCVCSGRRLLFQGRRDRICRATMPA